MLFPYASAIHKTFWNATSWFPSPALKWGWSTPELGMVEADRDWDSYLPPETKDSDWCPSGETGTRWLRRLYNETANRLSTECTSNVERVGGRGDGGKLVCTALVKKSGCLVYSLGSGNNFAFELEMATRFNCEIHTFDCTITSPSRFPVNDSRIAYHPWCVGGKNVGKYYTLQAIRKKLNHSNRVISVLKMDIERHEFAVVQAMSKEVLPVQMLFETHLHNGYGSWGRPVLRREWTQYWQQLWSFNYSVYAHEPNSRCKCCCEFSLVHRSHT